MRGFLFMAEGFQGDLQSFLSLAELQLNTNRVPCLEKMGILTTGKQVLRLDGSKPGQYGYVVVDPDSVVVPIGSARANELLCPYLDKVGIGAPTDFPQLYLLVNAPKQGGFMRKPHEASLQYINADSAEKKAQLKPPIITTVDLSRLDSAHFVPIEQLLSNHTLNLTDQTGRVNLIETDETGNPIHVWSPHYRDCRIGLPTAEEMSEIFPQLKKMPKLWKGTYAKEIWRRVLSSMIPGDKERMTYQLAGINPADSEKISYTLEELEILLLAKQPTDFWREKYEEMSKRANPAVILATRKEGYPPHMNLVDDEAKIRFALLDQLSRLQSKMYAEIAGTRGLPLSGDDLSLIEQTAISQEVHEIFQNKRAEFAKELPMPSKIVHAIQQETARLKGHEEIRDVQYKNMGALSKPAGSELILAGELCPLYENKGGQTVSQHARPAPISAWDEREILASMVGGKWTATKAAIEAFSRAAYQANITPRVRIGFGDVGVIVSKLDYADPGVLHDEALLYHELLREHCDRLGVSLDFFSFSELAQSPDHAEVPQFCIVNQGQIIEPPATLEDYLQILGMSNAIDLGQISQKRQKEMFSLLQERLINSGHNVDLFRALVQTYTFFLKDEMTATTANGRYIGSPDLRLGMEINPAFIALTHLVPAYPQELMPAVNILVNKPK